MKNIYDEMVMPFKSGLQLKMDINEKLRKHIRIGTIRQIRHKLKTSINQCDRDIELMEDNY